MWMTAVRARWVRACPALADIATAVHATRMHGGSAPQARTCTCTWLSPVLHVYEQHAAITAHALVTVQQQQTR